MEAITSQQIQTREVTHYHPAWTEQAPGGEGTFTIQLILDQGAEEYVLRPTADDAEVLLGMLGSGEKVYFDLQRKVLMLGIRPVGS
jgi:hypothetical protein